MLLEMDEKWMKCAACARPILKTEASRLAASNNHKGDTMGATWTPERKRKFKATIAAKRREREAAAWWGGPSKPSPARGLTKTARRPQAAAAPTGSNGLTDGLKASLEAVGKEEEQAIMDRLTDGLTASLEAVVKEEEQAIMDRVKTLKRLKEAIAAL